MLDEDSYESWLNASTPITEVHRVDPNRITFHQVGKAVGNVRNDDVTLIDEVV
jgi:putative SOS response-associated peptidase YedK